MRAGALAWAAPHPLQNLADPVFRAPQALFGHTHPARAPALWAGVVGRDGTGGGGGGTAPPHPQQNLAVAMFGAPHPDLGHVQGTAGAGTLTRAGVPQAPQNLTEAGLGNPHPQDHVEGAGAPVPQPPQNLTEAGLGNPHPQDQREGAGGARARGRGRSLPHSPQKRTVGPLCRLQPPQVHRESMS
jgi:hypothetical protein